MELYTIPKHLDDPARFLFWPVDEAAIALTIVVIGLISDHLIIGLLFAIIVSIMHTSVKRKWGKTVLIQAAYWYFPPLILNTKSTPPSYIRSYLG